MPERRFENAAISAGRQATGLRAVRSLVAATALLGLAACSAADGLTPSFATDTTSATQVAVTVSRVVALAAVARAGRDRAARMREDMSQGQLKDVLEKQKVAIQRLEHELKDDFQ